MYSVALLLVAMLALPFLGQGLASWRQSRSPVLLFVIVAAGGAILEAGLAGIGRWLGPGTTLRDLYAFPALVRILILPMTLFTFATVARRADFAWARIDWGHGGVCLLAVVLLLGGLPALLTLKSVEPACWQDVVWYVAGDPGRWTCPDQIAREPMPAPWLPQVTGMVVLAAWLGLGAGLWWRKQWPWLLAAMGIGIGLMAMPRTTGPLPGLTGQVMAAVAMVMTTRWQLRQDTSARGEGMSPGP